MGVVQQLQGAALQAAHLGGVVVVQQALCQGQRLVGAVLQHQQHGALQLGVQAQAGVAARLGDVLQVVEQRLDARAVAAQQQRVDEIGQRQRLPVGVALALGVAKGAF